MSVELQGGSSGAGLRVAVVVANFNDFITSRLLEGARAALARSGAREDDITVVRVPGAFELPLVAKRLAESGQQDAVICLGAVIRGETDHYEHVAGEAAKGISNAALSSGVPVIFGVLTTDTLEHIRFANVGGGHPPPMFPRRHRRGSQTSRSVARVRRESQMATLF